MQETKNYANSRVLILGGGDGGLLKELLELPKPPKQVIMIDLDDAVMIGCAEHMRSVSGSYMDKDKRKGSNYDVICGDAIEYMEKAKVLYLIKMRFRGIIYSVISEVVHISKETLIYFLGKGRKVRFYLRRFDRHPSRSRKYGD